MLMFYVFFKNSLNIEANLYNFRISIQNKECIAFSLFHK